MRQLVVMQDLSVVHTGKRREYTGVDLAHNNTLYSMVLALRCPLPVDSIQTRAGKNNHLYMFWIETQN